MLILALPVFSQGTSQHDRDTIAAANAVIENLKTEHAQDVATINRLIAEKRTAAQIAQDYKKTLDATKINAAAIAKVGAEGRKREDAATFHAAQAQQAVSDVQDAAIATKLNSEDIKANTDKVVATADKVAAKVETLPTNYIPVWIAAISSLTSVLIAVVTRDRSIKAAKAQEGKIDQVHVLVNSEKTLEKEHLLLSNKANLVLLQELIELKTAANKPPSPDAVGMLEATKAKILELETDLKKRVKDAEMAARTLAVEEAR